MGDKSKSVSKSVDGISELANTIISLQKNLAETTMATYGLEAENIIRMGVKDGQRIERILDRLLETAFDERVLRLYKKLCRHLYFIDEQAAIFYVQSYREMWDEESLK